MEYAISIFLGIYLLVIGLLCYCRIKKDYKGDEK